MSGEWVNEFIPNNGRKKGGGKLYVPSTAELVKRNIRRSWTISSTFLISLFVLIVLYIGLLQPTPPYALYLCVQYTYSIHTGKGGGGESLTREKVRGATVHNAGSKIPT